MRKELLLLGWVIGILFPFGWLCVFSDTYRQVFDTLFGPLWAHIAMHILLYSVLAYLLARFLLRARFPQVSLYHLGSLLLVVLIIALLQEGLQLLYQGRLPGADEWLDTGVDLTGGLLGIVLF
jgi:VanZ family protein